MESDNHTKKERSMLYERIHYRAPFGHVALMTRFNAPIPEELLKKALSKSRTKYPMMGARVEQDNNGSAKFVFDNVIEFQIKVLKKNDDNEWLQIAWEEQKKPFNLNKGPLIRFALLSSSESSDLVILCNHVICDGLSLTYLANDVVASLNEPNREVEAQPLPPIVSEESFTAKTSPGLLGKLVLKYYLNRSWKKGKVIFDQNDYEQIHRRYWASRNISVTFFTLPENLTTALISRCHMEQVSVNSVIITAFALAQNAVQGTKTTFSDKVGVAANIRHLLKVPVNEAFGLLAAGNFVRVSRKRNESFWNVAKRVNSDAKKLLSNPKKVLVMLAYNLLDPTLVDAMWFAAYGDFKNKTALTLKKLLLNPADKPTRRLAVTNLGKISIDTNQKQYTLKTMFFIPPYWANSEKIIGVVTAGGVINICILHDCSYLSKDSVEKFKQKTLHYIKEVIEHSSDTKRNSP